MRNAAVTVLVAITAVAAHLAFAVRIPGAQAAPAVLAGDAPRIEVAFVLDTTGSMNRLIQGAKQKIWTIARRVAGGRPAPVINLGLVGYRDRGDQYVTKVFNLTNDLDAIYGHLIEFQSQGGGDTPESVNQALHEAVTKLSWSGDANALKIVFLVGDAPPHMDYDDVKYPETIRLAAAAGIIINTIQCGNNLQTTPFWQDIASKSGGEYIRIDQSGGMTAVTTPVDAELSRLSRELADTVVPYGDAARQGEVRTKAAIAGRADAERMVYLNIDSAEFGAKVVVTGEGELIWDVVNRKVKLEEIPESDLPVVLKTMTHEERTTFVAEQFAKRKDLQIKVDELAVKRDAHIRAAMTSLTAYADSFDAKVAEIIQAQALRRGIKYEIVTAAEPPK